MWRALWVFLTVLSLLSTREAVAARQVSPKDVALRLSDLPAGFTQIQGRFYTNAQAVALDGVSLATLNGHGRLLSYDARYQRSLLVGIVETDDTVAAYKTSTGAHWDYMRVTANARSSQLRRMSARSVGSERAGYTYSKIVKRVNLTVDAVLFRRGSYTVLVQIVGVTGSFNPGEVTRLAQIIDRRARLSSH